MVRMNRTEPMPEAAERRLEELAKILARGVLRVEAKKSGFPGKDRLEVPAKTRLSVTTCQKPEDCEVT